MGKDIAMSFKSAKMLFQELDEILQQNLSKLIFEGPIEDLTLTANTQPALMAVSLAIVTVLEQEMGMMIKDHCSFVAGHSLGEYTALAAAHALTFQETAKLLRTRGSAMQNAVPVGQGAMAALLGSDFALAETIAQQAAQGETCQIANDNAPGQIVLSGTIRAIERAMQIATSHGKKIIKLPVSAPFHSELMKPAQRIMEQALSNVAFQPLEVPIVTNVKAEATSDPVLIKELLVEQVVAKVRWRESIHYLAQQGVTEIVEIGAGKVLGGLIKRIEPNINILSIQTPHDIEAFVKKSELAMEPS
jgi:[acyl-carrier-protein] S-malonyltransferase